MTDCQELMDLARQQGYDQAMTERALAETRRLERWTNGMQVFAVVLLAGILAYRVLT